VVAFRTAKVVWVLAFAEQKLTKAKVDRRTNG